MTEATQRVPNPFNSSEYYYSAWQRWWQQVLGPDAEPQVTVPGGGSDHVPFAFGLGIPIISLGFIPDYVKYTSLRSVLYPTYPQWIAPAPTVRGGTTMLAFQRK